MKTAYLVEIKYIKRGDLSERKMEDLVSEAKAQLEKYAEDRRIARPGGIEPKKLVLVFSGWELKVCEEC